MGTASIDQLDRDCPASHPARVARFDSFLVLRHASEKGHSAISLDGGKVSVKVSARSKPSKHFTLSDTYDPAAAPNATRNIAEYALNWLVEGFSASVITYGPRTPAISQFCLGSPFGGRDGLLCRVVGDLLKWQARSRGMTVALSLYEVRPKTRAVADVLDLLAPRAAAPLRPESESPTRVVVKDLADFGALLSIAAGRQPSLLQGCPESHLFARVTLLREGGCATFYMACLAGTALPHEEASDAASQTASLQAFVAEAAEECSKYTVPLSSAAIAPSMEAALGCPGAFRAPGSMPCRALSECLAPLVCGVAKPFLVGFLPSGPFGWQRKMTRVLRLLETSRHVACPAVSVEECGDVPLHAVAFGHVVPLEELSESGSDLPAPENMVSHISVPDLADDSATVSEAPESIDEQIASSWAVQHRRAQVAERLAEERLRRIEELERELDDLRRGADSRAVNDANTIRQLRRHINDLDNALSAEGNHTLTALTNKWESALAESERKVAALERDNNVLRAAVARRDDVSSLPRDVTLPQQHLPRMQRLLRAAGRRIEQQSVEIAGLKRTERECLVAIEELRDVKQENHMLTTELELCQARLEAEEARADGLGDALVDARAATEAESRARQRESALAAERGTALTVLEQATSLARGVGDDTVEALVDAAVTQAEHLARSMSRDEPDEGRCARLRKTLTSLQSAVRLPAPADEVPVRSVSLADL